MKRTDWKFFILLAATLAVVLSGCVHDSLDPDGPDVSAGAISIPFTIDGMQVETRASTTEPESSERKLENVHVLFFDAGGNYVTYARAKVWSGTSSFTLTVPDDIRSGTSYQTLIVGNANSYPPEGYNSLDAYLESRAFEDAGYNLSTLKQQLYARQSSLIGSNDALPMWGELHDGSGLAKNFEYTQSADGSKPFTGSVNFSRSVCRLDLKNVAATDLIIEKVKVCNYRSSGYYFKDDPRGERSTGLGDDNAWVTMPAASNGSQELTAAVYTFPNYSENAATDDLTTTYLMIAGYYQDGSDNTTANPKNKLTYYRFNMATTGSAQNLQRNHLYRGTIISVKGAGSDNESGAATSAASLLSYSVEDTWDDGDSNTATDANGNYLSVSRSALTFDGSKGLTKTVQVKVNDWQGWSCSWLSGSEFFSYSRTDSETLSITTLADNTTGSAQTGTLQITSSVNSQLAVTLTVIQLSGSEQTQMLLVDGQVGTVNLTIPGEGGTAELLVQTGVSDGQWKVSTDDMGTTWGSWGYTQNGGNNSYFSISLPANLSGTERSGKIKVYRVDASGKAMDANTVSPVTILITQPASRFMLSISPTFSGNTLSIEAFDDGSSNPNGLSWQKQIFVSLTSPGSHKWKVTSTFKPGYDLFLTKSNASVASTAASFSTTSNASELEGTHGESFWINVFRTAPGDPDIKGTISISAVNTSTSAVEQTLTLAVTITTNCVIDDVKIGNLLIADRNLGTARRWNDAYATVFYPAYNYTNDGAVKISGFGSDYSSDNATNASFKGSYATWTEANGTAGYSIDSRTCSYFATVNQNDNSTYYKSADADKWQLPTQENMNAIKDRLRYSKQRAFIVSDEKDSQGHEIGCFFPLSGYSGYPSGVYGYYWSSTTSSSTAAYYLTVNTSSSSVNYNSKTNGYSMRCVRPLQ